jgi:cell division septation protein DedD
MLVLAISLAFLVGCSDEAKNDAARLEQELSGDSAKQAASDSIKAPDTTAKMDSDLDAGAVPNEDKMAFGPTGSGYALQVASCESSDYAQYLLDRYIGRGYLAYVTPFNFNGQTYYRVRLGPYETREEATRIKAEVLDKYSVDAWIDVE